MGQYYKPCSLEKKEYVYSHDIKETHTGYNGEPYTCGNGLKLMEHSWRKNRFVNAVAGLIAKGGAWHGDRLVWAGDYADNEISETLKNKFVKDIYLPSAVLSVMKKEKVMVILLLKIRLKNN